jgi:hypothetical protein
VEVDKSSHKRDRTKKITYEKEDREVLRGVENSRES